MVAGLKTSDMLTSFRRIPALFSTGSARALSMSVQHKFERLVRFIDEHGVERVGEAVQSSALTRQAIDYNDNRTYSIKKFLPPVTAPEVICVGLNYKDHADEVKLAPPALPVVFGKASTSLVGHLEPIQIPPVAAEKPEVDFEGELAAIIGRECKDVSADEALSYVLGYCVANDVSARRWQGKKGGSQWYRCKSFDTFGPMGPELVSARLIPDPNNLSIRTTVNGNVMQDSNTSQMVFGVKDIIAFCSQGTTLRPGTVILTGTPAGVGFARTPPVYLRPGDMVEITIENIGTLSNTVA